MPLRKRWVLLAVFLFWGVLPEWPQIPVAGASARDWNPRTFWFEPWGRSGVHKGIDIFAKLGTPVHSASYAWCCFVGRLRRAVRWWSSWGRNGAFIITPTCRASTPILANRC